MLIRTTDHQSITRESSNGDCIIKFSFEVFLEDDEVLKTHKIYLENITLGYGFINNLRINNKKRIPKRFVEANFKINGKEVGRSDIIFEAGSTFVNVEIILDSNYCSLGSKARSLTSLLTIQIANGTTIRDKIKLHFHDHENAYKIYSPFLNVLSCLVGFGLAISIVWVIYHWALDHRSVYQSFSINAANITAICAALFAYFGIPRLSSISTLVPRHNYIRRLLSYIKYPEYYFDQYLIKMLRNWIVIILLVISSVFLVDVQGQYKTYSLDIEELGDTFVLGPKNQEKRPKSSAECTNNGLNPPMSKILATDGELTTIDLAAFETSQYEVLKSKINQLFVWGLSMLESLRIYSQAELRPQRIYSIDIDKTCLYLKSIIDDDRDYRFCVAELSKQGEKVTSVAKKFRIGGNDIVFDGRRKTPGSFEGFLRSDHPTKAFSIMRGHYRNKWEMEVKKDPDNDCASTIVVLSKGSDVTPYTKFLRARLDHRSPENRINLAGKTFRNFNISKLITELKKVFDKQLINEDFSGTVDNRWQAHQVFSNLADRVREIEFFSKPENVNVNIDNPLKLPSFYTSSYRGENRAPVQHAIAEVWYGLQNFARLRNKSVDGTATTTFRETNSDQLVDVMSSFLNENFRKLDCRKIKIKNVSADSLCNNTRRYYSDFLILILMVEKEFSPMGYFHKVIVNRLIRDNDTEDIKNYLIAATALDAVDNSRGLFFKDFYFKTKEETFGCTFNFFLDSETVKQDTKRNLTVLRRGKFNNCIKYI